MPHAPVQNKLVVWLIAHILLYFIVPAVRADLIVTFVDSGAYANAEVSGSSATSQSNYNTFPPGSFSSGLQSAASGAVPNTASAIASVVGITPELAGSTISATGSTFAAWSLTNQTANVSNGAYQTVYFTVTLPHYYSVSGSIENGGAYLLGPNGFEYFFDGSGNVAASGLLAPGDYIQSWYTFFSPPIEVDNDGNIVFIPLSGTGNNTGSFNMTFSVPEPTSLVVFFASGVGTLIAWRRRKNGFGGRSLSLESDRAQS